MSCLNFIDIFKLFECSETGPVSSNVIAKLQSWNLIAKTDSIKCDNGHFYQLVENADAQDGFQWRCHELYVKGHRKRARCDQKISIRANTFFQNSHLSLFQIVAIAYLWLENTAQRFLIKQARISSRTAVDWSSFNREVVVYKIITVHGKIGGPGKTVEINESKFGRRKYHRGHRVEGQWVLGGLERVSGRCFLLPVESRDRSTLLAIIKDWIEPGTTIISDFWKAYDILDQDGYNHHAVNHSVNFVDPITLAHTNTVEGMWRHAKAFLSQYGRKKHFFEGSNIDPLEEFFKIAGELYDPVQAHVETLPAESESESKSDSD